MHLRSHSLAYLWIALLAAVCLATAGTARASGPHWVAGVNYFNPAAKGAPVVWAGGQLRYYLDQGALSASVSNSQAASLVAGAAAVWSAVPTAAVAITNAGTLSEDVSGSNVTANVPSGTGATLPADAQPSATSKPIAIVFDTDGSVIDDIYGAPYAGAQGASDPASCDQNGVFSTVDNFATNGTIAHALILINGRCATSSAMQALLQYQLVRAFGRVLGLDWSQVNETMWQTGNVTTDGLNGWPIMHPYERLCTGTSTNCLPNPLTLRLDDIAGLNQLYPVTSANAGQWSGKTQTAQATLTVQGTVSFRNGQGMQGVNVVLTPLNSTANGDVADLRYTVSAVSGDYFCVNNGNPITGPVDFQGNAYGRFGSDDPAQEGFFSLRGVPLPEGASSANYRLSIEPINPLYSGNAGLGPYASAQVLPSGAVQTASLGTLSAGAVITHNFVMSDSADGTATDDGIVERPSRTVSNGQWVAKLVGYGHTGWFQFHARANRLFTVEAASVDESGQQVEGKAAELIGLWDAAAPLDSLPALSTTVPFNGAQVGLSVLSAQTDTDGDVRVAYADARGDGRPDFTYQARVLYADSVFPARLTLNGGPIVIEGRGFRPGVTVTLNGVSAAVTSISPTEITAQAASVSAPTGTVVLTVRDPQTLGQAQILDGLAYDAQGSDGVRLINAPSGTLSQGVPMPMTVQVIAGDATTPAANVQVSFSVVAGAANLTCAATPCTALSNASGYATIWVSPATAANTEVTASLSDGASVTTAFNGGTPPQIAATNTLYLAIGGQVSWSPTAIVLSNGAPVQGASVRWTGGTGAQIAAATNTTSNAAGLASTPVTAGPLAAGVTAHVTACQSQSSVCTTFNINAVHTEAANLLPVSGVGQSLTAAGTPVPTTLEVIDGVGHAMAGATVTFFQRQTAWQPPCPTQGRCPTPQQLASSTTTAISDANGMVTLTPLANGGLPVLLHILATTGQAGSLQWTINQRP